MAALACSACQRTPDPDQYLRTLTTCYQSAPEGAGANLRWRVLKDCESLADRVAGG